jgi:hypothetical protein
MAELKYLDKPAAFLVDSGLLYEINRKILHPLGLALSLEMPSEGEPELTGNELVAKIWDERNDPEGIVFEEETLKEGQAKFNKFVATQDERFQTRLHRLGFVRQPAPTVEE